MEIAGGVKAASLDLLFGDGTDDDDKDDWENEDEWLMVPMTPPEGYSDSFKYLRVIDDLCMRMDNLEYRHGSLVRKMGTTSDAQVADGISIGEIWPRVTTVEGKVQVMVSQAVQVVSKLEEIETKVQLLRTRLAKMESRKSTLMSYMLWMEEHLAVLEKKLPGPTSAP
nr:hypothetical protein [Tanacetum cinerariifolium]